MTDTIPDGDSPIEPGLNDLDADAVERALSGRPADDPRDRRVADLLSLLDTPVPGEGRQRAASVAAFVQNQAYQSQANQNVEPEWIEANLSEADGEALDAWALSGYSSQRTPAGMRDRAARHEQLSGLLSLATAGESSSDADQRRAGVLERIREAEASGRQAQQTSMRFEDHAERTGLRFRLPEVFSVAAVLAIAVGVAIPVIGRFQQEARKLATASDFSATATAFAGYKADHDEHLPVYDEPGSQVVQAGALSLDYAWWNTGANPAQSNSANLFTLVRMDYAKLEDLASPGNRLAPTELEDRSTDWNSREEVSYSYRVVTRRAGAAETSSRLTDPSTMVLLTDRSPLEVVNEGNVTRSSIDVNASSPNHQGRGQYRLLADGSARWSESPWLETNDNLWLPRWVERAQGVEGAVSSDLLTGRELPEGPDDAFVGP